MAPTAEGPRAAVADRHPSDPELLELALGGLDSPHVTSCPRCAARLQRAAELLHGDRDAAPFDDAFYRRQAVAVAQRVSRGGSERRLPSLPWLLWPSAAAAAALVLVLLFVPGRRQELTQPPPAAAAPVAALTAGDTLLEQIDAVLAADPYDHAIELWSLSVSAEAQPTAPPANG